MRCHEIVVSSHPANYEYDVDADTILSSLHDLDLKYVEIETY
jgi:hypothetical protein